MLIMLLKAGFFQPINKLLNLAPFLCLTYNWTHPRFELSSPTPIDYSQTRNPVRA